MSYLFIDKAVCVDFLPSFFAWDVHDRLFQQEKIMPDVSKQKTRYSQNLLCRVW